MKTQGSTARVEEFRMILYRLNALPGWPRFVALAEVAALVYWLWPSGSGYAARFGAA